MSKEAMKLALEAAYLAGWNASGEGYNSEYPFGDHARNPEEDAAWVKGRDDALREALVAQQEPVAWVEGEEIYWHNAPDLNDWIRQNGQPLYTSPPAQRTWVGLTHDEYDAICDKHSSMSDFDFLEDIEIKLKEKNT